MCGGTDLVKDEGVFVCQNCGVKYSVAEARRMMGEGAVSVEVAGKVTVENSFEIVAGVLKKYKGAEAEVVIPDNVKHIEASAFEDCIGVKSVIIPDGVESIGPGAFAGCILLESIDIPNSVNRIGSGAITDNAKSIGRNILGTLKTSGSFLGAAASVVTDVHDSLKGAFENCQALKDITLPKGIRSIEVNTFRNSGLERIVIPEGVTQIGVSAFSNNASLSSVSFPSTLVLIGPGAFKRCPSLKSVALPARVITLVEVAFDEGIQVNGILKNTEKTRFISTDLTPEQLESPDITLEKIEVVKDRAGVNYHDAKEALEAVNGDVVVAIIEISKIRLKWEDTCG
jgi:hypothetical protein